RISQVPLAPSLSRGAFGGDVTGGFEDGPGLHLVDLGVSDAEPATAMAEHRVEFMELRGAALEMIDTDAERIGELGELGIPVRQELVQRRVEQADRARQAGHRAEDLGEVRALLGKQ